MAYLNGDTSIANTNAGNRWNNQKQLSVFLYNQHRSIKFTGVFWLVCMTGVLILEWPNLTDEEWHLGRREELFALQQRFFFPYLLCDSRLPGDEFQNQNSEFAQGGRRGNWVKVRDQWEWPTSSEIRQAIGNEERQKERERIYLQQVNKKMKAESN